MEWLFDQVSKAQAQIQPAKLETDRPGDRERERERERGLVSPARWHCPALGCGEGWGGALPHTGVTGDGGGKHADLGTH